MVTCYKWDNAGPLLFLLFITDTPDDIKSSVKIFADYIKALKDVQTEDDLLILQKDVDSLRDWSLSGSATRCTRLTYANPKIRSQYNMKEGDKI